MPNERRNITSEDVEAIRAQTAPGFRAEDEQRREATLGGVEDIMVFLKENAQHIGAMAIVAIGHQGEPLVDRFGGPSRGMTFAATATCALAYELAYRLRACAEGLEAPKTFSINMKGLGGLL